MYKLRFHLGAGKHFMHWQLKIRDETLYYSPIDVTIHAYNVTLRNQAGVANKIFQGANKTVCAWLDCEFIDVSPAYDIDETNLTVLNFNPKNFPHWTMLGDNYGCNIDGKWVSEIVTVGRSVLTPWALETMTGVSR